MFFSFSLELLLLLLFFFFFCALMFSLIEYVSSLGWLHNNWITFRHLSALHLIHFMQLSSSHYNGRFNNSTVASLSSSCPTPSAPAPSSHTHKQTHNGRPDKLNSLAGCSSRSQVSAHELYAYFHTAHKCFASTPLRPL